MPIRRSGFFIVLFVAEIGASLWRLVMLPSDAYPGSLNYVVGRLLFWAPLAIFSGFLMSWVDRKRELSAPDTKEQSQPVRSTRLAFLLGLGLSIETLTTVFHWESPYSRSLRRIYESVIYWHRVLLPNDYGLASLRGYFLDHLIPWVTILVSGLILCRVTQRIRS